MPSSLVLNLLRVAYIGVRGGRWLPVNNFRLPFFLPRAETFLFTTPSGEQDYTRNHIRVVKMET